MPIEPGTEREVLDSAGAGAGGVARELVEYLLDGGRQRLGSRRLVAFPRDGMWDRHPGVVDDELGDAAALRIDDGQPRRHRLDDDARAGVVDLRMQEQMGSA